MEITEVKVFPVGEEKLKAFVSIVFDRCFMVNDIKIIQGKDSLFISMPSRRKRNGKFKDVAHPLNTETRQRMERQILAEYERVLEESQAEKPESRAEEPESRAEEPESRVVEEEDAKADSLPESAAEQASEEEHGGSPESTGEKSLEEVAEIHLRDSFWTT